MQLKSETNRFYACDEKGEILAEIMYCIEEDVVCIHHTFVSERCHGQGIGNLLVMEVMNVVLQSNKKVKATCSYAYHWLEKHKEYDAIWIR